MKTINKKKAALFDLDKTITKEDTIVRFLFFYVGKRKHAFPYLVYIGVVTLLYGMRVVSNERMKRVVAGIFRGETVASLDAIGKEYAETVVPTLYHQEALDRIARLREEGCFLVLISASFSFYVKHIAAALSFDAYIGSELWRHHDRVTGHLYGKNCRGMEKIYRLYTAPFYYDIDYSVSEAYSDSHSDLPLLEHVGHAHCINPDRKLTHVAKKRGYTIHPWGKTS